MKAWRSLAILLALPASCDRDRDAAAHQEAAAASSTAIDAAPLETAAQVEPDRLPPQRHRRGLVGMMLHAAHDLPLAPAQGSALDAMEDQVLGADESGDGALRGFEADVARGIRAGKIDATRMQADFAAIDSATRARHEREARALGALHDTLDPSLRASLVVLVRARRAAHALRSPEAPEEGAADWTARRLDRLSGDLGLDAAQRPRAAALLAQSDLPSSEALQAREQAATERADALLAAFKQETLDAGPSDRLLGDERPPHEWIEREVRFLSRLIPLLTPEQRGKLAAMREQR